MINEEGFPRCDWSGLQRVWCPEECPKHGSGFSDPTPEELEFMGLANGLTSPPRTASDLEQTAGRPLPAIRHTRRRAKWQVPQPRKVVCLTDDEDHRRPPGMWVCHDCADILRQLRADVPALIVELRTAIRKDTAFAQVGDLMPTIDPETGNRIDESALPWNEGAARALEQLTDALTIQRDDIQLATLSAAARRAHQILDRPRDMISVGRCPLCREPISMPRPSHQALEDGEVGVACGACSYAASWSSHQKVILDQAADTLLTIGELVGVLTQGGEPITRKRIEYLVARHGLPREPQIRWHQRGHGRVLAEVMVYKLRDVRHLQAQLTTKEPR